MLNNVSKIQEILSSKKIFMNRTDLKKLENDRKCSFKWIKKLKLTNFFF